MRIPDVRGSGQKEPVAHAADFRPRRSWPRLKSSRLKWGFVSTAVIVILTILAWQSEQDHGPHPRGLLFEALKRLDRADDLAAWHEAGEAAEYLDQLKYRDPDLPGATEFIRGIVAFREARLAGEGSDAGGYRRAVQFLREAEEQSLHPARRPQLAYALGMSLARLGRSAEAEPLLAEAIEAYEP